MKVLPAEQQAALDALFDRARKEGLWFWCGYQDLWFSPDELAAQQRDGFLRWSAENWNLRDPREHLAALRRKVVEAQRRVEECEKRMGL